MARRLPDDPYRPDHLPDSALPQGPEPAGCRVSYNLVTGLFLLLTLAFAAYFALLLANPYVPLNPFPPRTPLPIVITATPDPNRPTDTPTPSKLPDTPHLSTLAPPTPTPSPILPSDTPAPTATAAQSTQVVVPPPPTTTATRRPTIPAVSTLPQTDGVQAAFSPPPPGNPAQFTRAPFAFSLYQDAVIYEANPNASGCNWSGIAGSVTALNGDPLPGLGIQLEGEGLDEVRFSGTALLYGAGGFEFSLNDVPTQGEYRLTLLGQTGVALSDTLTVRTSTACDENVALVNFVQNHPF